VPQGSRKLQPWAEISERLRRIFKLNQYLLLPDFANAFENDCCNTKKDQPDEDEIEGSSGARVRFEDDFVQSRTSFGSRTFFSLRLCNVPLGS
jgi:hypothetical protein